MAEVIKGKTQQVPACPKGFVWCPNSKKCIPAEEQRSGGKGRGMGRGQGKGPMGVPTREEQAEELLNLIFDEGFEKYSKIKTVEKQIDILLDSTKEQDIDYGKGSIDTTGRPYEHPKKGKNYFRCRRMCWSFSRRRRR